MQRHGAQKCSEIIGPNKKVVASRSSAHQRNQRTTGKVDESIYLNFANILIHRGTFQCRIKRVKPPTLSHLITNPHLLELYMRNFDSNFETFFQNRNDRKFIRSESDGISDGK